MVSIDFPDRTALAAFYDHPIPKHPTQKRIAESLIKPITASLLIVDYEERSSAELAGRTPPRRAGRDH